jgi:hypothetical protein
MARRAGIEQLEVGCAVGGQVADDVADDRQRMLVILGDMVDHARLAAVEVAAAQILRADHFAGRGLHQRRAGEEDRALVAHDHALVGHGGNIGAARGAAAHHAGDLRDALGRHVRLVEEDAAEMVAIGEDLGLVRQVGAARIDQIDTRQPVGPGDLLRAEMLLDRHRIVSAALHRRIVAHDHHRTARDAADAGDHPRARHFAMIHVAGGELADFEERRAGIEQPLDSVAGKQLAARGMLVAGRLRSAERSLGDIGAQPFGERAIVRCIGAEGFAVGRDLGIEHRAAHK